MGKRAGVLEFVHGHVGDEQRRHCLMRARVGAACGLPPARQTQGSPGFYTFMAPKGLAVEYSHTRRGAHFAVLGVTPAQVEALASPTAYGHREVLIRGYVDAVVISCGAEVIARHPRSYEREDFVFDPLHYLALLEHKIGALDQAAPLVGWDLPEEFATLRRLIEARMGKRGKREFVQILRLLEVFRIEDVQAGVSEAIARGAIGFDAVKHLVLCRIERRPPRLDLTVYPYLPRAKVATTSAKAYLGLLAGAAP